MNAKRFSLLYVHFLNTKNKFILTLPNSLLNFKQFYNLNDFWSLQIKSLSTTLIYQFNNSSLYKNITLIRLFQLQLRNILAISPLNFWPLPFNKLSHRNLIS